MNTNKRLAAIEAALQATYQAGKPTPAQIQQATQEWFKMLERYAAREDWHPEGATLPELIARGHYDEALASRESEEARQQALWLIILWEAHQRGIDPDDLLAEEIRAREAAEKEQATRAMANRIRDKYDDLSGTRARMVEQKRAGGGYSL
jgi:hypothetical protein